jgi:hypothetical protein
VTLRISASINHRVGAQSGTLRVADWYIEEVAMAQPEAVDGAMAPGGLQMMASGLLSAALFLFMSHARPLVTLAPRRPPATIVCVYMAFTVFAQVRPWTMKPIIAFTLASYAKGLYKSQAIKAKRLLPF